MDRAAALVLFAAVVFAVPATERPVGGGVVWALEEGGGFTEGGNGGGDLQELSPGDDDQPTIRKRRRETIINTDSPGAPNATTPAREGRVAEPAIGPTFMQRVRSLVETWMGLLR